MICMIPGQGIFTQKFCLLQLYVAKKCLINLRCSSTLTNLDINQPRSQGLPACEQKSDEKLGRAWERGQILTIACIVGIFTEGKSKWSHNIIMSWINSDKFSLLCWKMCSMPSEVLGLVSKWMNSTVHFACSISLYVHTQFSAALATGKVETQE